MITLLPGRSRRHLWRHTLILCLLAAVSACGQKGALYLPEPAQESGHLPEPAQETDGSEQAD